MKVTSAALSSGSLKPRSVPREHVAAAFSHRRRQVARSSTGGSLTGVTVKLNVLRHRRRAVLVAILDRHVERRRRRLGAVVREVTSPAASCWPVKLVAATPFTFTVPLTRLDTVNVTPDAPSSGSAEAEVGSP